MKQVRKSTPSNLYDRDIIGNALVMINRLESILKELTHIACISIHKV